MIIKKELKFATFFYDDSTKSFSIVAKTPGGKDIPMTLNSMDLNKTYAFAFARFVLRISQRNWLRRKLPIDKVEE